MDLSQSVVLPREDFMELQMAAWQHVPVPVKDRIAQTIQTSAVCMGLAAAVVVGTWGCFKAVDWLDERQLKRTIAERESQKDPA